MSLYLSGRRCGANIQMHWPVGCTDVAPGGTWWQEEGRDREGSGWVVEKKEASRDGGRGREQGREGSVTGRYSHSYFLFSKENWWWPGTWWQEEGRRSRGFKCVAVFEGSRGGRMTVNITPSKSKSIFVGKNPFLKRCVFDGCKHCTGALCSPREEYRIYLRVTLIYILAWILPKIVYMYTRFVLFWISTFVLYMTKYMTKLIISRLVPLCVYYVCTYIYA